MERINKQELIDKIFKTGDLDTFLKDYLISDNKDDLNYLCEKYLEYQEYHGEPFDVIYSKIETEIYARDDMQKVITDIVNDMNDDELITWGKEYGLAYDETEFSKNYKNSLVKQLEIEGEIEFNQNKTTIVIWETDQGEDNVRGKDYMNYMYNLYDNKEFNIDGKEAEEYDGGLCTGAPKDAIEMAIDSVKANLEEDTINNETEKQYCVLATYDDPCYNYTAWFNTYKEAEENLIENDSPDANIAIGKIISFEEAQTTNKEVCFAFNDGSESVYLGGEIEETYKGLPLITYSFEEPSVLEKNDEINQKDWDKLVEKANKNQESAQNMKLK